MTSFEIIAGAVIWAFAIKGCEVFIRWIFTDKNYKDKEYRMRMVEIAMREMFEDQNKYGHFGMTRENAFPVLSHILKTNHDTTTRITRRKRSKKVDNPEGTTIGAGIQSEVLVASHGNEPA